MVPIVHIKPVLACLVAVLLFPSVALGGVAAEDARTEEIYYVAKPVFAVATCQLFGGNIGYGSTCFPIEPGETQVRVEVRDAVTERVKIAGYFYDGAEVIEQFKFCDEATLEIPAGAVRVTFVIWNGWGIVENALGDCEHDVTHGVHGMVRATFS